MMRGTSSTSPLPPPVSLASKQLPTRDDTSEEAVKYGPGALLDRDVLADLSRLRPLSWAWRLAFDYGLIVLVAGLCETFWHPALYVLTVMTIGGRQAGIGSVALHDGVHRLLTRNRRLNDLLGRSMCGSLCTSILIGFDPYRDSHFAHHRTANTKRDPDIRIMEKFYKAPRWKAALIFSLSLTGLLFVLAVVRYFVMNARHNPLGAGIVFVTAVALLYGWYVGSYPAILAVKYWFVPLATWGIFANQVRALAEHYPEHEYQRDADFPRIFRTRDVIPSWFDAQFMTTRGVNYHLSHHLCPQVPSYNLPRLQRELAEVEVYHRHAHVTHGYHRFFAEYFFQRSEPVGFMTARHAGTGR